MNDHTLNVLKSHLVNTHQADAEHNLKLSKIHKARAAQLTGDEAEHHANLSDCYAEKCEKCIALGKAAMAMDDSSVSTHDDGTRVKAAGTYFPFGSRAAQVDGHFGMAAGGGDLSKVAVPVNDSDDVTDRLDALLGKTA